MRGNEGREEEKQFRDKLFRGVDEGGGGGKAALAY